MNWIDVILDREIDDMELKEALALGFGLPIESVTVIRDYEDFLKLDSAKVVAHKSVFSSGYRTMISLYLYDTVEDHPPPLHSMCSQLSLKLKCKCMVPSDGEDPSEMLLFSGKAFEIVSVDEEFLNLTGSYRPLFQ